ncbi:hypothetical protein GGR95_003647 [Sulfitobacter undariae]|uniref:Uncharacterized protein n=1 Tax=Sulfitobacter undariae TaxID=1563671 RepID=A0A7W6E9N2_9RHOB|nr:glycosidase-like protein [Sulfitobacter undariae]MBB3995981.1 hypothetical protein [Sulfitobacter undariae]
MIERRTLLLTLGLTAFASASRSIAGNEAVSVLRGFNLIETQNAQFGSNAAKLSIERLASTGATAATVIPFLWQPSILADDIILGSALPQHRIVLGIEQLHAAGLAAIVKPHVWVPQSWAGAIEIEAASEDGWYSAYSEILQKIAVTAEQSKAEVLVVGTELRGVSGSDRWESIIAEVRKVFSGKITYVAHGASEAEEISFWPQLDAVAVSLYPILGAADDSKKWDIAITDELDRVQAVAQKYEKPVWVAEIGIRSAEGATERPWESAEERVSKSDMALQAEVLKHWLIALEARQIQDVWIWRWFTDPDGGGEEDTDFTVQNKDAEDVVAIFWNRI